MAASPRQCASCEACGALKDWELGRYNVAGSYVGMFCYRCLNELYVALRSFGEYVNKRRLDAAARSRELSTAEIVTLLGCEDAIFRWITEWVNSRPMKTYTPLPISVPDPKALADAAATQQTAAKE